MRATAILLIILTTLAGCIGGGDEPDVETAATDGDASPAPSSPAAASPASAAQPKPSAAPASAAAPAANQSAEPAAPVAQPYSWDAELPPEVCAPVPTLGCAGAISTRWWDAPELGGVGKHAKLDLTWTSQPGGPLEMRFVLLTATPCEGDGCWTGEVIQEVSGGSSPLAIDTDIPALEEGQFIVVGARAKSLVPDPLVGWAHAGQAFSVAGTFTVQP